MTLAEMQFVPPELFPASAEIFLLAMTCVILMVDLFVKDKKRTLTFVLTQLTLVGAAVMSAGGRQPLFDSIPSLDRSQCTDRPAASTEVGRHGHGRQGDLPFPVQCEAVQIRVMGRTEYKTAQPELGT